MRSSPQLRQGVEAARCGNVRLDQFRADADAIESAQIERTKFRLADDDNRRGDLGAGEFVTDEDAGQIVREARSIELVQQRPRPHPENMVEQAILLTRAIKAGIECV